MSLIPQLHSVPAQADHRQGRDASHRSGYRGSPSLENDFSPLNTTSFFTRSEKCRQRNSAKCWGKYVNFSI